MPPKPKKTKTTIQVLEAFIERLGEEVHGFKLVEDLGLKSGTAYPLLIRLEKLGWLESRWEETSRPGPRRRLYRLTAEGEPAARRFLAESGVRASASRVLGFPAPAKGAIG